jgi:hypothetical protein
MPLGEFGLLFLGKLLLPTLNALTNAAAKRLGAGKARSQARRIARRQFAVV